MLTANNNPKEDANNEIPDGHRHHDARNSDVLCSAHAVTCVPKCLLNEVNSQYKDESTDNHDRYDPHSYKQVLDLCERR